jgi:hypothetical protein
MAVYRPTVLSLKQQCTVVIKENRDDLAGEFSNLPRSLRQYVDGSRIGSSFRVWIEPTSTRYSREWIEILGEERYNIYQGNYVYVCGCCISYRLNRDIFDRVMLNATSAVRPTYEFPDSPGPTCVLCSKVAAYWYEL